jgi:hypothetical protein
MSLADQERLIPGGQPGRSFHPVLFCYSTKFLVYLFYAWLLLLGASSASTFLLTTLLNLVDFWCTQTIHGFELVGLSWSVRIGIGFASVSKPDPFVPNTSDSNAFWMSFFVFIILWAVTFLIALFTSGAARAINAGIAAALQILNLLMFMRAHRATRSARDQLAWQQAEEVEGIDFRLMQEEPDQSGTRAVRAELEEGGDLVV